MSFRDYEKCDNQVTLLYKNMYMNQTYSKKRYN